MIKPWLFEFLPELSGPSVEPDPRDVAALFARYLDLWARDEALGFEGIFFSEHHFGRSYSASPNLLIAAKPPGGRSVSFRFVLQSLDDRSDGRPRPPDGGVEFVL